MQAHADPQRCPLGPGVRGQGSRGLCCGQHGLGRSGEGHEEGIALRIYLHPAVRGEGGSQQLLMQAQGLGIGWPQLLEQAGAAFDVGEQEGDGAGRQVVPTERLTGFVQWRPCFITQQTQSASGLLPPGLLLCRQLQGLCQQL
jgi:hypothetical protein